jgi:beta-N-acetylhexosaminidase
VKRIRIFIVCLLVVCLVYTSIPIIDNVIIDRKVDKLLSNMSLDEKIGQMLMVYYPTLTYDDKLSSYIKSNQPGGFIVFKNNVSSYDQLSALIKGMQSDSDMPMFISIDQEGGKVQRIGSLSDEKVTIIPPMQKVGETNDTKLAYQVGKTMGEELNTFGINMDNAPVLDIQSNSNNTVIGNRSFGNNATIVSKMALSLAKGLSDTNIIPVYKHFPGYGDTDIDPHYNLPVLNQTKEELYNLELKPFIKAINNGAEAIMVGHIALPKIVGDNTPATLSKVIINDILRNELGFKGVVITDALNMKALANIYSTKEILIQSINAGADILLMPPLSDDTTQIIREAIYNNEITEKEINDANKRILTLKYKAGLFDKQEKNDKDVLGSTEHQDIIKQIEFGY